MLGLYVWLKDYFFLSSYLNFEVENGSSLLKVFYITLCDWLWVIILASFWNLETSAIFDSEGFLWYGFCSFRVCSWGDALSDLSACLMLCVYIWIVLRVSDFTGPCLITTLVPKCYGCIVFCVSNNKDDLNMFELCLVGFYRISFANRLPSYSNYSRNLRCFSISLFELWWEVNSDVCT